jgi:transcriptional regulator with XRE-family HTH domain
MKILTPGEYKAERKKRGNQQRVAALLGVSQSTISERENRKIPISREATLALLALPIPKVSENDRDLEERQRNCKTCRGTRSNR